MLLGAALLRFHAEAIAAIAAKTDEEIPQGLSKAALIAQFEALVLTHFRSTADGGCGSFSVTSPCRSGDSRYAFSMDFNIPSGNVVADLDEAHQIMGFEAISVGAMHDIQCQLDTVSWVTRMRIGTMSGERAVIRRARQADADGTARVHIASADDALAPLARQWPASDINRRTEQWVKSLQAVGRLDMVATVADQVVGFIGGGPPRQQDIPGAVEIYVIHVLPTHRCAGVGGQLWESPARLCVAPLSRLSISRHLPSSLAAPSTTFVVGRCSPVLSEPFTVARSRTLLIIGPPESPTNVAPDEAQRNVPLKQWAPEAELPVVTAARQQLQSRCAPSGAHRRVPAANRSPSSHASGSSSGRVRWSGLRSTAL
jgi:hypothetical protein